MDSFLSVSNLPSESSRWRLASTITDFEITCGHQSISVRLPRMTDHKCTWLVGVTNQHHEYNFLFSGAWLIWLHRFEPANFFFSHFFMHDFYCTCSHQFLFPPLLIYAQPNLDLNLHVARRAHFVFGVKHVLVYFKNDRSKSKVLGRMTTQHLILIWPLPSGLNMWLTPHLQYVICITSIYTILLYLLILCCFSSHSNLYPWPLLYWACSVLWWAQCGWRRAVFQCHLPWWVKVVLLPYPLLSLPPSQTDIITPLLVDLARVLWSKGCSDP